MASVSDTPKMDMHFNGDIDGAKIVQQGTNTVNIGEHERPMLGPRTLIGICSGRQSADGPMG